MKRYFVICDEDEAYVRRFSDYVNEHMEVPCFMQAFTNAASLEGFCQSHVVELLLVGEDMWEKTAHLTGIRCRVKLAEQRSGQDAAQEKQVYRYQSVQTLMNQVMSSFKEQDGDRRKDGGTNVIGIYSPVKRSLKSSFGLALGQILSRDQTVLYLSMEMFSGLLGPWHQGKASDLSDILYYVRQGKARMTYWADACIRKVGVLDCIFPPLSPLDLQGAEEKDWRALMEELTGSGRYQTVILDIDESSGVLLYLLGCCHRIYTTVLEDAISRSRLDQYEQFLRQTGHEDIWNKTVKIRPPFHKGPADPSRYVEEVAWGELGDYVRTIIWDSRGRAEDGTA